MIKHKIVQAIAVVLLLFSIAHISLAQYGSEWIVPGQSYLKAQVLDTGMYQIPLTQLSSLGLNVSDQAKIQVWRRGVEQSVQVANNALYFLAYPNDGATDSLLYKPYSQQPNKYYSLYTDSAAYFITVGSNDGKRWSSVAGTVSAGSQPYLQASALQLYADEYDRGKQYTPETRFSWGDEGEGWMSAMINSTGGNIASTTKTIVLPGYVSLGTTVQVQIQVIGRNLGPHMVEVTAGGVSVTIPTFVERETRTVTLAVPVAAVTGGQLDVVVSTKGSVSNSTRPDAIGISYIKVTYPRTLAVNSGLMMMGSPAAGADHFITLTGALATSYVLDITQEGSYGVINATFNAGALALPVPASTAKMVYHDGSTYNTVAALRAVDMTIYPATANYLLVSHWKLWSGTTQYAAYRASAAGGGYNVLQVDVTKLYDLYSYGDKSPIAIRRFCEYQIANGAPRFLFIMGKGLYVDYQYLDATGNYPYYRKDPLGSINNLNAYWQIEDLVPTYGAPASDVMYSEGLGGNQQYMPALATGRYPARTNQSVLDYLDKVVTHEALPQNALWRKNLVHMSGGANPNQITAFKTIVNGFKAIAEDAWFGGQVVVTFSKSVTSGTVDQFLKFSLVDEVNKGLSQVTFFGHSSASVTDVEIGNPSDPLLGYNNVGKYPLLYVNGCMSAAAFYSYSFAEDWMITPQKGAIAVIGHSDVGYDFSLQRYTTAFYQCEYADSNYRDKTIGEVQQLAIDSFLTVMITRDHYTVSTVTQMMLYADPAVKIYRPLKTDYEISGDNEPGVQKAFLKSYFGNKVTADADSFAIGIPVINFGSVNADSVSIHVKRVINNSVTIEYEVRLFGPVYYNDTLYFVIKDKNPSYIGANFFEIKIDYFGRIEELNENNNLATLNYYMPVSGVICLLPTEFSVVNQNPAITLVAQTSTLLSSAADFYLEFDTTATFTGPAKISTVVNSISLINWNVSTFTDLLPSDSVVYYWRVRFNIIPIGQDTVWATSSFIYIKPSNPGWSQSEYPQFPKDQKVGVNQTATGAWAFTTEYRALYVKAMGNPGGVGMDYTLAPIVKLGNLVLLKDQYDICAGTGVAVLVLDKTTANYKFPQDLALQCGYNFRQYVTSFANTYTMDDGDRTDNGHDQTDLINYLNAVAPGDYVLILNMGNAFFDDWSPALKSLLISDFGAQKLNFLSNNMPYYLLAKKGGATALSEQYSTNLSSFVQLDSIVRGTQNTGYVTSTMIGPSSSVWGNLYRDVRTLEPSDKYELSIIRFDLTETPIDTISIPQTDALDLNPLIDFNQYPFIKLLARKTDSLNLTTPQLKRWQVIYNPAPEGVYDYTQVPTEEYNLRITQEGSLVTVRYVFKNITTYDFTDSMKVLFRIVSNGVVVRSQLVTVGPRLRAGESVAFTYSFNTSGLSGDNVLQAYMNPKLQAELYYVNNIAEVPINVQADRTNPVVDVTFDGVHILDGDVVSPSPQIYITINDNNQMLLMTDTTSISLFLIRPGSPAAEPIYMSNPAIKRWGQDPGNGNKFIALFQPDNLPDGVYTLVLQGIDKSGNKAAANTYQIKFEVVNKSTLTHFYPYPNPFSSSCRFVFTLTGSVIPEDMTIQIMTVTGKVVKEITMAEIGPMHAGNNITEYAWDGRDNYGDLLANGVYLYRVLIKNPGSNFEHRETSGDQAFKKDFGKLYILR